MGNLWITVVDICRSRRCIADFRTFAIECALQLGISSLCYREYKKKVIVIDWDLLLNWTVREKRVTLCRLYYNVESYNTEMLMECYFLDAHNCVCFSGNILLLITQCPEKTGYKLLFLTTLIIFNELF